MSNFNYLLLRKSIEFCSNEPCKRFRFKCAELFCTLIYNLDEKRVYAKHIPYHYDATYSWINSSIVRKNRANTFLMLVES